MARSMKVARESAAEPPAVEPPPPEVSPLLTQHAPSSGDALSAVATPFASAPALPGSPPWRASFRRALRTFAAAFALLFLLGLVEIADGLLRSNVLAFGQWPSRVFAGFAALSALLFLLSAFRGVRAFAQIARTARPVPWGSLALTALVPAFLGACFACFGAVVALTATFAFARGRQLRRLGRVLLPRVQPGSAWAALPMTLEVPAGLREAMAAQWRENGRTEHASVAAFARLTLDLLALGAPPRLLDAASRDARDEIRHAEICFSIARALDGQSESPGPFPEAQTARTLPRNRTLALAQLAVDSLVDGALHEGVSARVISRLAKRCEEPGIRAALRELAADEGRHAAHGWDIVDWCVEQGGEPVRQALRGAVCALPPAAATPPRSPAWEPFGLHGSALEEEEYARALIHLEQRISLQTAA